MEAPVIKTCGIESEDFARAGVAFSTYDMYSRKGRFQFRTEFQKRYPPISEKNMRSERRQQSHVAAVAAGRKHKVSGAVPSGPTGKRAKMRSLTQFLLEYVCAGRSHS